MGVQSTIYPSLLEVEEKGLSPQSSVQSQPVGWSWSCQVTDAKKIFSPAFWGWRCMGQRDLLVLKRVNLLKLRFLQKGCSFGNIDLRSRLRLQKEKQRDAFICLRISQCLENQYTCYSHGFLYIRNKNTYPKTTVALLPSLPLQSENVKKISRFPDGKITSWLVLSSVHVVNLFVVLTQLFFLFPLSGCHNSSGPSKVKNKALQS